MIQYPNIEADAATILRRLDAHRLCERLKDKEIKYTVKDGRITVESRATRENGEPE